MLMYIMFCYYLLWLVVPVVQGLRIFGRLDGSMKIIWMLLAFTFLSELTAGVIGRFTGNNLFVYHFYTPLSFLLVVLYFHRRLPLFRRYRLGYPVAMAGIVAEVCDTLWYHPYDTMDVYAILVTAFCGLVMVLLEMGRWYIDDNHTRNLRKDPGLRVSLLLGLFWCASLMLLGSGMMFSSRPAVVVAGLQFLWSLNNLVHIGIGYVFFSLTPSLSHPS